MITAFQTYLVLQLDSIRLLLAITLAASIFCISINIGTVNFSFMKKLGTVIAILVILVALVPSSQTAAAMFILPAITSEKVTSVVAPEVAELYNLAKGALKSLGDEEPAATPSK